MKNGIGAGAKAKPADHERHLDGTTPLWAASRELLAGHEREFFSRWRKVAEGFGEDDVHDLRVASRRLREGLALFAPCLPARQAARLDQKVKQVTRMLGELRNTDEACLFFSSLAAEETALSRVEIAELLATLGRERERAHRRLRKELGALQPGSMNDELLDLGTGLNIFRGGEVDPFLGAARFAADAVMERAETVNELLPRAVQEEDSEAQHALRIAVKKLRYRLEIVAPLLTKDYRKLHDALKGYQEILGKLHDIDVFREMVSARLAEGAGRAELFRVMAQKRAALHAAFRKRLKEMPLDSMGRRIGDALR